MISFFFARCTRERRRGVAPDAQGQTSRPLTILIPQCVAFGDWSVEAVLQQLGVSNVSSEVEQALALHLIGKGLAAFPSSTLATATFFETRTDPFRLPESPIPPVWRPETLELGRLSSSLDRGLVPGGPDPLLLQPNPPDSVLTCGKLVSGLT